MTDDRVHIYIHTGEVHFGLLSLLIFFYLAHQLEIFCVLQDVIILCRKSSLNHSNGRIMLSGIVSWFQ